MLVLREAADPGISGSEAPPPPSPASGFPARISETEAPALVCAVGGVGELLDDADDARGGG